MKKYHLADALTAIEVIMAVILIGMTIYRAPPEWAIWVFVIGQLCDAFDGVCARRWPYPNDDKPRWWRKPRTVQIIEHVSDILLIVACAFYLLTRPGAISFITLLFAPIIIGICACVEYYLRTTHLSPHQRLKTIRRRRYAYLSGIAIGIALFIFATNWPPKLKHTLCITGIVIGIGLAIYKWDRLRESHETFLEFLRRIFASRR